MSHHIHDRDQGTSSALLEQLVYIDNFMTNTSEDTPNLDVDGQLSLDLAAFADDSFIFPDSEKPKKDKDNDDEHEHDNLGFGHHFIPQEQNENQNHLQNQSSNNSNINELNLSNLLDKPSSLLHNHHEPFSIHETNSNNKSNNNHNNHNNHNNSNSNSVNIAELPKVPVPPGAQSSLVAAGLSQNQIDLLAALVAQHQHTAPIVNKAPTSTNSFANTPEFDSMSPVRQHNHISTFTDGNDSFKFEEVTPSSTTSSSNSSIRVKVESPNNLSSFNVPFNHKRAGSVDGSDGLPSSDLDKRRRNTAASARFRIKKKQKEKEMEQTIVSLNDATHGLELKIQQLEMENKLLRNLIVEKGSKRSEDELKQLKQRAQQGDNNFNGVHQ
ncbi:hypothetical protein CAAN1_01S05380 [[Candida] anglica]|uniref:BZIP domain-containing protein n=1 Tax=[Candida] anglica TaxID=148631 RepID=A0ABP0EL86_9ASCO